MDGYEVARRLKERAHFRDTVLIAVSGYGQKSDMAKSLEAGLNYHLVKPVDFEILIGLLEEIGGTRAADGRQARSEQEDAPALIPIP